MKKRSISNFKLPKFSLKKITPLHVVYILSAIAAALFILLLVLLLNPDDGVPEITIPTTTVAEGTADSTEGTTDPTTEPVETEPTMLPKMAALYEENPDIVGWITIPDTNVDYPVMYTPYDPEKYIHANFKEQYSVAGLPFIEDACSLDPESDNLIIYAHNMNNGTMFQNITNYAYKRYWKEHPLIYISTLYEERTYEIIAAFKDRIYSPLDDVFKFYQFIDAEDEEAFNTAIKYYKEKSEYDTGLTAEYGDNLITLVTCAYHVKNGRFVVVAREVKPEVENTVPTEPAN